MSNGRLTERCLQTFSTAERPVCVPYNRESECTKLYRLIPKKVGSKSARRERVYKRAAETRRDFFRRGGARQAGGCHALPRGTELSGLCSDEAPSAALAPSAVAVVICLTDFVRQSPAANTPGMPVSQLSPAAA